VVFSSASQFKPESLLNGVEWLPGELASGSARNERRGLSRPRAGFCHGATPFWVALERVCLLAHGLHGKSSAVALERPAGPRHFKLDRHRIAECR
jgi:hypothetical protein